MTNLTIVSCYYKIPSKRTHNEYDLYISNLLTNIKGNMIIYTSVDLVDYLNNYIGNKKNIIIIVKPFESLEMYTKYLDIFKEQEKIDNHICYGRTYYCYIIWNSKLNFIKECIESNPFNSDKFMWLDIGAVRTPDIITYLEKFPIYDNVSKEKIDITLIHGFNDLSQKFFRDSTHLGGLYAGGKDALLKFNQLFYKKLDEYLLNNKFIGCDQQIINSVYLENLNLFNIINPYDNNYTESGKFISLLYGIDAWFYIIYYYSF